MAPVFKDTKGEIQKQIRSFGLAAEKESYMLTFSQTSGRLMEGNDRPSPGQVQDQNEL